MADILTDSDIQRLLAEAKPLPDNYQDRVRLKTKRGHKEAEVQVVGQSGATFRLILRQSNLDALDFSVIVGYEAPTTNILFRLRRYNGKSHEHTNKLERQTFFDIPHPSGDAEVSGVWHERGCFRRTYESLRRRRQRVAVCAPGLPI